MTHRTINELLRDLTTQDPRSRELAAAYIGDWLIGASRSGTETGFAINALVEALSQEEDPAVQEEIAHSLGYLIEHGTVPQQIINPLQQRVPYLDPAAAEHVAEVLHAAQQSQTIDME